uniref:Doublecortin-like kinase 3 n=1 Tax=Lates calcarifer TaxID=8187 RepID=A0A4W6CXN7_LATCA
MMQNELSLLGSLCHPRIVRLFAHHHTRLMVSDMSEALNYIHCKSIVHRDLKPENLLVGIRVSESGLVCKKCDNTTEITLLSVISYGVAVDVWALGVILYILLCGFPPFRSRERDQEELFQLIKQGHLHFLSPYWDPISEGKKHRNVIYRMLAMASVCRQRALTDKTQRNTAADAGAEPERVQRPAQTNAAETVTDKRLGHTGSEGDITQKELSRTDERWSEMNTGREHDEDKTPQQQSNKTSTAHKTSGDTPGQQKPECISTDSWPPSREPSGREIQDSCPKLSNCEPGSTTSPRAELNQLGAPVAQTELSSQIKTQLKQNSQHQSPPASPPSANAAEQTTAGHSTQHHPSSSPAAPSSHSPSAEP